MTVAEELLANLLHILDETKLSKQLVDGGWKLAITQTREYVSRRKNPLRLPWRAREKEPGHHPSRFDVRDCDGNPITGWGHVQQTKEQAEAIVHSMNETFKQRDV